MRVDITSQIASNQDYIEFLRQYPSWHLELNRYPENFNIFVENYRVERKMTFPDRLEKVSMLLQMMEMLM
jgi:hypothetical protein